MASTTNGMTEENHNLSDIDKQIERLNNIGKYQNIIDIITQLPKEQLSYDILIKLAAAYNSNNEYKKALKTLMQIKEEGANTALWNYNAGCSCYYLQKYKDAEKYFTTTLELNPDNSDASSLLLHTYIELSRKKIDISQYNQALKYLDKCRHLVKNNNYMILFESEYVFLYRIQGEYEKAYKSLQKVMKLGRNDSWVYAEAGLCLFELEQYDKAIDYIEKSLALGKKDSWLYYYAALCADSLDDNQKQLKYLEEGVELYPDDADLNYVFGVYYINQREFNKALDRLNKANEYDDKAELYTLLGLSNEKLGKYDEASEYYEKALSIKDLPEIRNHISTLKKRKLFY